MPRSSQMGWLGFSLLLLVLGLAFGNLILLAGAFFVLFTLLAAASITPPSGVRIERTLPRTTCWAGDSMMVRRRMSAPSGMGPILVHDALPQELEVSTGNNLRVIWKWPGAKDFDLSYTLTLPSRGEYHLPATEWQTQAPMGIRRSALQEAGEPLRISVVPRIRGITRLNEIRVFTKHTRFQEDLTRAGISDSEFRELRPYAPGDPIKLINWKATSRGSRNDALPLVNELEPEGKKAVWVFMDAAHYMDVGLPTANPMENMVEAAGSLAQFFLSRGSTVGAYAYNCHGGGELLSPEAGKKQFRRLAQMLTNLEPGLPEHDLLRAIEWCKGFLLRLQPDVFVITRLDVHYPRPGDSSASMDRLETAVKRLTTIRKRARRPGLVRVVHISAGEPQFGQSQDFTGIGLAQWEGRSLANDMRRSGADVIEWNPATEDFIAALVKHMGAYG